MVIRRRKIQRKRENIWRKWRDRTEKNITFKNRLKSENNIVEIKITNETNKLMRKILIKHEKIKISKGKNKKSITKQI